jgi:hypothetical protein
MNTSWTHKSEKQVTMRAIHFRRSRTTRVSILIASFALAGTDILSAHDLWLLPPSKPDSSDRPAIRAHSGMEFPISEHAPDPTAFASRVLVDPSGKESALDDCGVEDLSGLIYLPDKTIPGIQIVGVTTTPKLIELSALEFNHYLVADGLPQIYLTRFKEQSLDQPGKERYSKSPKTIFRIGTGVNGDPTKAIGLPLEIIPEANPFELEVADTLSVRVLFRTEPLVDANLGWDWPNDGPLASGTIRTDSDGRAQIPISKTGLLAIRLTHMTRPKHVEYEWESYWTTLTFEVPLAQ